MSKEGFLISHEEDARSAIYYCVLGEGKFQFYSKRHSGVLVREVILSKSKLKIRGVPDEDARDCAFSFSVHLQRSKIKDGRLYVYGKPIVLLLSAPTWGERKAWGNAIHAWQRNYWGEPQHRVAGMASDELEAFFLAQQRALESALEAASLSPTFSTSSSLYSTSSGTSTESLSPPPAPSQGIATSSAKTNSKKKKLPTPPSAAAVSRALASRAQAVKSIGSRVGKKLRAKSTGVTFSLPPMGLSIGSSVSMQQPQAQ